MKKNRIILINPTDPKHNFANDFGPPYGLSLIAASLLKDKRPLKAYDFCQTPLSQMLSEVVGIIKHEKPAYLGIATQSSNRGSVYSLIQCVKKIASDIVLILGGPFATSEYKLLLDNFCVDFIVLNEGEKTIVELLNCLDQGKDPYAVEGLAFRKKTRLVLTKDRDIELNLDAIPYPAFFVFKNFYKKSSNSASSLSTSLMKDQIDLPWKLTPKIMALSSRGCVYRCNFCNMSKNPFFGIRGHESEYFVDLLVYLKLTYLRDNLMFIDNFFTFNRERTLDICSRIIKRNLNIRWSCMTRSDAVDQGLLAVMAEAGCVEILYGVESGSARIQESTGKKLNLVLTKKAFQWSKEAGIRSILNLMVGNVGETKQTIRETMAYVQDIDAGAVQTLINRVYPGTVIHDIAQKNGIIAPNFYLTSQPEAPVFAVEHAESELKKFKSIIGQRSISVQIYNRCNNRCSFCRSLKGIKNFSLKQIKQKLFTASMRTGHIILFGGEPLLRKNLSKIFSYAERLFLFNISLETNCRMFMYERLAKQVNEFRSLRKVITYVYGFSDVHDKITKHQGSFEQTIQGIKNLKVYSPRLEIQVKILILSSNYMFLEPLAQFFIDLRVNELKFVYLKDYSLSLENNGRYLVYQTDLISQLKKISILCKNANIVILFEGFTPCVVYFLEDDLCEFRGVSDEFFNTKNTFVNARTYRMKEKIKFKFCAQCRENDLCEGVWKLYVKKFQKAEFHAI